MREGVLSPGTLLLDTYRIVRWIGEGGTGEVYVAESTATTGRSVAIKVLKPAFSHNPAYISLLERELLQNVKHDAVVSYLGLHQSREHDGAYFLVMEYIDGPSLAKLMQRGPVAPRTLIDIGRRVAQGLKAAHGSGVFHRDISPDNVILRGNDPGGATLIDFGIAKDERPHAGTVVGHGFAGKYEYASPEQIDGRVDARSDIYSLGATLLAAARGKAPEMPVSRKEIDRLKEQPLDVTGIPQPLAGLIQRMTAPAPEDRIQTAAELVRAFDGEDVLEVPTTSGPGSLAIDLDEPEDFGGLEDRSERSYRWLGWVAAAVLLLGVIGAAFQQGWIDRLLKPSLPLADPYRFSAEFGDPATISGHAPSAEAKAMLEAAVGEISDGQQPLSALALAEGMPSEAWVDAVAGIVRATEPLDQWQIDVIGTGVVVKGLADSGAELDSVVRALRGAATTGPLSLETKITVLVQPIDVSVLDLMLRDLDRCGGLTVVGNAAVLAPTDAIRITGRATGEDQKTEIRNALEDVADGRNVDLSDVQVLNPFVCRIVNELAARETSDLRFRYAIAASGQVNATNDFRPSDVPVIDLEIPAQIGGFLTVFLADNEGAVLHRVPRPGFEAHRLDDLGTVSSGRRWVRVAFARGDPACSDRSCALYIGGEPFGTNYMFAVVTDTPLFEGLRPGIENVDAFAPDFADAVARASARGALRSVTMRPLRVENR